MSHKKAYIIHGWSGSPNNGFKPWLKSELEARGYAVESPQMPDTDTPKMETWLPFLQNLIQNPDEETILIGHSMGGAAVLRYLETLPEGTQIKKVILVAPVVDFIKDMSEEEKQIATPWLETPFDFEKVKRSAKEIIGFFSDNDKYIPPESATYLKEKFGAKIYIEHQKGHYSNSDGTKEVPQILETII